MKKKMAAALSLIMAASMAAVPVYADEEKPTVTLMIEIGGYAPLETAVQMVKDKFPEYNIISKEWSIDGVKKAIKTTLASGGEESVDIGFYAATGILGFAKDDMLVNLSPYAEEDTAWSGALNETLMESCTYDGNIYGIPWQAAYPVMVANMDVFEACGVEPKDDWTYDELMEAAETFKENGYYAFGISSGYSAWVLRQSYLNGFDSEEELHAFNVGETPITDERVVEAFDRAVSIYKEGYCYPGEGAIATTDDELNAGMANGKIAMYATTNNGAALVPANTGITNTKIINFPSFSNYSTANLLGSPDVFIVPANAKNLDATIEVLKYLTGDEVLGALANLGTVVPLKEVNSEDPNYAEYSKDLDRLHSEDFGNLSDEIGDYINVGTAMTNYLYEGEAALEELEQMRKNVAGE